MGNSNIRPRSAYDGVREFAFTVLTLDALVFYGISGGGFTRIITGDLHQNTH